MTDNQTDPKLLRNRLKPESNRGKHPQIIKCHCYVSLGQANPICHTETVTDPKQNCGVLLEDEEILLKKANH